MFRDPTKIEGRLLSTSGKVVLGWHDLYRKDYLEGLDDDLVITFESRVYEHGKKKPNQFFVVVDGIDDELIFEIRAFGMTRRFNAQHRVVAPGDTIGVAYHLDGREGLLERLGAANK